MEGPKLENEPEMEKPKGGFSIADQLRDYRTEQGGRLTRNQRRIEEKRIRKEAKKQGIKL